MHVMLIDTRWNRSTNQFIEHYTRRIIYFYKYTVNVTDCSILLIFVNTVLLSCLHHHFDDPDDIDGLGSGLCAHSNIVTLSVYCSHVTGAGLDVGWGRGDICWCSVDVGFRGGKHCLACLDVGFGCGNGRMACLDAGIASRGRSARSAFTPVPPRTVIA